MKCRHHIAFQLAAIIVSGAFLSASVAMADSPKTGKVFFVEPKDHAIVTSPVRVVFGLTGMKILPAGKDIADKSSGHHHIIIDGSPITAGQPVPTNASHVHYGKGQTEATLNLSPGVHKLTLQFADGAHLSYGEALSSTIEITVK